MTNNTDGKNWSTGVIKIDIDYKLTKYQKKWLDREIEKLNPKLVLWTKSRKGIHIKIKLHKQVRFWRSIELRAHLHDDPQRIVFDILRYRSGAKMIDVLFDKKTHIKEIVRVPEL